MSAARIYTVTEITKKIKLVLDTIPSIWIRGELSNFTAHHSGHMYFTLKDEQCQIKCVMWKEYNVNLFFTPQDGMMVLAQGDITVYERAGQYQLRVLQLQPVGIGDLQLAFERLKEKLAQEGLFDKEHKKSIPTYPERIGVISSPVGAAIQDIITIVNRRFPGTQIILYPVKVQGDGAAGEITQAIDDFNAFGDVDVLILTRGGGSLEDLWAFNEEVVARAIFRSEIPVISAVGHEVDFTIADFVADVRAPTPSVAGELVVPEGEKLSQDVRNVAARSLELVERSLQFYCDKLKGLISSYGLRHPLDMIHQYEQKKDELTKDLVVSATHVLRIREHDVRLQESKLNSLNPVAILRRGYSVCKKLPGRNIVREAMTLEPKDEIEVAFHKGSIQGIVRTVKPE